MTNKTLLDPIIKRLDMNLACSFISSVVGGELTLKGQWEVGKQRLCSPKSLLRSYGHGTFSYSRQISEFQASLLHIASDRSSGLYNETLPQKKARGA